MSMPPSRDHRWPSHVATRSWALARTGGREPTSPKTSSSVLALFQDSGDHGTLAFGQMGEEFAGQFFLRQRNDAGRGQLRHEVMHARNFAALDLNQLCHWRLPIEYPYLFALLYQLQVFAELGLE